MRSLEALSVTTETAAVNGAWLTFENLRDDKILLVVKWDGTSQWNLRVQARALGTSGSQFAVTQFWENERNVGDTNWTTGNGPFSHEFDATNNTFHIYLPKLPMMRVRLNSVDSGTSATLTAWFVA